MTGKGSKESELQFIVLPSGLLLSFPPCSFWLRLLHSTLLDSPAVVQLSCVLRWSMGASVSELQHY
jgi:hypothetical protein